MTDRPPEPAAEVVEGELVPLPPDRSGVQPAAGSVTWRQRAIALRRSAAALARQPAVVAGVAAVSAVGANVAVNVARRLLQEQGRDSAAPRVLVVSVTQQLVLLGERRPDPVRALPPGSSGF